MPGPPPKDPAARARRNAAPGTTTLPAAGRPGPPPPWPLPRDVRLGARLTLARRDLKEALAEADADDLTPGQRSRADQKAARLRETVAELDATLRQQRRREVDLWRDLWATPMATEWERLLWVREIAVYVRFEVLAELGDRHAAAEARLRAGEIGLTPMSLLRLRWRIASPDPAPQSQGGEDTDQSAAVPTVSARARYGDLRMVPGS